jgi:hypothetical protein
VPGAGAAGGADADVAQRRPCHRPDRDWFNWRAKMLWIVQVFRDRWQLFDIASGRRAVPAAVQGDPRPQPPIFAQSGAVVRSSRAVYVLLPRIVFGSAYADMRLVPFLMAIGIIAIRPKPGLSMRGAAPWSRRSAWRSSLARIAATTWSFFLYDKSYDRELKALDHLPEARGWSASSARPATTSGG